MGAALTLSAMESVDLVIVGAGFAGLRAARAAARRGLRTLVLERKATLGEPVRTSGASWIAEMERLGIPPCLYHPVRVAHVHSRAETATLDYPEPVGCILDVARVIRHLAGEARALGAEIRPGTSVTGVLRQGDRVVGVRTRAGEIRAGLVLDASGISNLLARELGAGGYRRYGLGVEARVRAPDWDPEVLRLWVGPPVAPAGYGWAFPEGGGGVRLGMGLLRPDAREVSVRGALDRLLGGTPEVPGLAGAEVLDLRHGAIPAAPPPLPPHGPGWLQAGDAAGHVSPLLGEGIRFCLETGAWAGEAAARALHAPGREALALAAYADRVEARLGWKLRLEHRLNRRIARLDAEGWDRAVRLLTRLPGELPLALLAGDFSPGLLLRMALLRPRLGLELGAGILRALRTRRAPGASPGLDRWSDSSVSA